MARFYSDASGNRLPFRRTHTEEQLYGAPAGAARFVDFDERTNALLVKAILTYDGTFTQETTGLFRLLRNGQVVAINPPGPAAQLRQRCFGNDPAPVATLRAKVADSGSTLTQADLHTLGQLAFQIWDDLHQLGRLFFRHVADSRGD